MKVLPDSIRAAHALLVALAHDRWSVVAFRACYLLPVVSTSLVLLSVLVANSQGAIWVLSNRAHCRQA
eukprot:15448178-Alexandrium_andersonii.AAC.1